MMQIKIKTENGHKIYIPVPYALLSLAASLATSEFILKWISKTAKKHTDPKHHVYFSFDQYKLLKPLLKQTITELRQSSGLVLVDVQAKNGTSVHIRL